MEAWIDEYFLAAECPPQAMDRLWAEGWRHFGPYFFRYSHWRTEPIAQVLPLRLMLSRFKLSQSQRRVLKRGNQLEIRFLPAFVDEQVVELFEHHKARFKRNVPPDIYTFVSRQPATLPCPCLSVCVFDQAKLIGISYLDVGEEATSSVYQCFDPGYAKNSLGILMILHSINWTIQQGKRFYYPGYAHVEPSEYDYKKRLGALEHYDWNGNWADLEMTQ